MVFNPAPLIIASMNFVRRMREQEKEKQLAEEEEKRQWKQLEFKPLEGIQVEIYPYYVCDLIEEYKTEPDGQINFLETVYTTKEIIKEYRINNGKKLKKFYKDY